MDLIVHAGHKQRLRSGRFHRAQQAGPPNTTGFFASYGSQTGNSSPFVLVMGELGAITINAREENVEARLKELTDGEGPNVALDCAGLSQTFEQALRVTSQAGVVVPMG